MNWDDLKFFLAVAREGTLTQAAKTLNVKHTTVSRRMSTFEQELGVRLFERLPRGYELTETGRDLLATAERVESEVNGLGRQLLGRDQVLAGPIRISTPNLMLSSWILPHITAFSQLHPKVELQVIASGALLSLARRELDVALRVTKNPPESAVGRKLMEVEIAVYGSRSYLEAHRHLPLNQLDWIGIDPADNDFDIPFLEEYLPEIPVRMRFNSSDYVFQTVRAGFGIARFSTFLGDRDPDLLRLPNLPTFGGYSLWLLTHQDIRHSARIRCFLDYITQKIKEDIENLPTPEYYELNHC